MYRNPLEENVEEESVVQRQRSELTQAVIYKQMLGDKLETCGYDKERCFS